MVKTKAVVYKRKVCTHRRLERRLVLLPVACRALPGGNATSITPASVLRLLLGYGAISTTHAAVLRAFPGDGSISNTSAAVLCEREWVSFI